MPGNNSLGERVSERVKNLFLKLYGHDPDSLYQDEAEQKERIKERERRLRRLDEELGNYKRGE